MKKKDRITELELQLIILQEEVDKLKKYLPGLGAIPVCPKPHFPSAEEYKPFPRYPNYPGYGTWPQVICGVA